LEIEQQRYRTGIWIVGKIVVSPLVLHLLTYLL